MKTNDEPEPQYDTSNRSPHAKSARLGAAIGAFVPVWIGTWLMVHDVVYRANLPLGPACGMSMLGAICMIIFVGPIAGIFGAIVGYTVACWLKNAKSHNLK